MTGPRLGVVQLVEVRRAADGAQHGVRARPPSHPRELPQSGAHLHQVRVALRLFSLFFDYRNSHTPSVPGLFLSCMLACSRALQDIAFLCLRFLNFDTVSCLLRTY